MEFVIKPDTEVITTVSTMVWYEMVWQVRSGGQTSQGYTRIFPRRLSLVEIAENARSKVAYFSFRIVTTRSIVFEGETFSKVTEEDDGRHRHFIDPKRFWKCKGNGIVYAKTRTGILFPYYPGNKTVRT